MELSVYKIDGTVAKTVTLNEEIFGIQPNDHAIYLDVKQYLANQRQGTAKSKDRSEVAYSTKKLIRQKGSGGARHGSLKAGIYVGGGRVFGPQPRCYRKKLNMHHHHRHPSRLATLQDGEPVTPPLWPYDKRQGR